MRADPLSRATNTMNQPDGDCGNLPHLYSGSAVPRFNYSMDKIIPHLWSVHHVPSVTTLTVVSTG